MCEVVEFIEDFLILNWYLKTNEKGIIANK